jgi:hypothetical protein
MQIQFSTMYLLKIRQKENLKNLRNLTNKELSNEQELNNFIV